MKTGRKLALLARLSKFMRQNWIFMKKFVESKRGYCLVIWMIHSAKVNRNLNCLHERSLRIVYNDCTSSFEL